MTERLDEFVVEIAPETDFGTISDFPGTAKRVWVEGASGDVDNELIDNVAYTTDLGKHVPIEGLGNKNTWSVNTYAEGLQTAAGDGVLAAATGVTYFHEILCGAASVASTGSTEDSVDTSTNALIYDDNDGNIVVNTVVGFPLADTTKGIECRPVLTYSSGNEIVPAFKTSEVIADGAILYGSINAQWADSPSALRTMQIRRLGADATLTKDFFGCVANLTIPATPPDQPQMLNWSVNMGGFANDVSDTRTDPTAYRPVVGAGGTFLLGPAHASAAQEYAILRYGSVSVNMGASYAMIPDHTSAAYGMSDWRRVAADLEVTINLPHDFDPSAASAPTGAGNGWGEATYTTLKTFRASGTNDLQLFCQWGKDAGKIYCAWFRNLYIYSVVESDVADGLAGQTVVLRRLTGSTAPQVVFAQL